MSSVSKNLYWATAYFTCTKKAPSILYTIGFLLYSEEFTTIAGSYLFILSFSSCAGHMKTVFLIVVLVIYKGRGE